MMSANYSRFFFSAWVPLLLVLVIRYRDPGQNIRYHLALLYAALMSKGNYLEYFL